MLDSGELYICELRETAATGFKPAPMLIPEGEPRAYERRRIGYGRIYAAKGADERVGAVYRIWDDMDDSVHAGQYVLTGSGDQYQIGAVQPTTDEHDRPVLDLTLSRVEDYYDIAQ